MAFDLLGELYELLAQLRVLTLGAAELRERAHDQDVCGDRALTVEDAREHRHALFRERVREIAAPPAAFCVVFSKATVLRSASTILSYIARMPFCVEAGH